MTNRMATALAAADSARGELLSYIARIDPVQAAHRANDTDWTPAQVLEHLRLVEDGIVRLLAHRFMRAKEQGLTPGSPPAAADGDAISLAPTRAASPEPLLPGQYVDLASVVTGLEASRRALRQLSAEVDPYDGTRVTARHVVLGEIHYYQWVHFVGAHELRHLQQIRRIVEAA